MIEKQTDERADKQTEKRTEKSHRHKHAGLDRRKFLASVVAAATAGGLLERGEIVKGQNLTHLFQDSFGKIGPANPRALALGIHPPPIPAEVPNASSFHPQNAGIDKAAATCVPATNATYYSTSWPKYNILLIMVDQMRASAFWPPAGPGGQAAIANTIPNITGLMNQSWVFPNYFVAATSCTPSRATLLTGLYAQQTCTFKTQTYFDASQVAPSLIPYSEGGFPSIGDVLSQCLYVGPNGLAAITPTASYDCTWIGKWHVSCYSGKQDGTPGAGGPTAYGFINPYSLPNTSNKVYPNTGGYPSPTGMQNEGNGGDFLDSFTYPEPDAVRDKPSWPAAPNLQTTLPGDYIQLNDAAIQEAFTQFWLPNAPTHKRWFCAVSFINPHDITDFPYAYGLAPPPAPYPKVCAVAGPNGGEFCSPITTYPNGQPNSGVPSAGYQPPPVGNSGYQTF